MTIEDKLQALRERWVKEPEKRASIELEAKTLKLALKAKPTYREFSKRPAKDLEQAVTQELF